MIQSRDKNTGYPNIGDGNSYRISSSSQISALLKNLMRDNATITLNLPREEHQYPSAILKVDDDLEAFYLDELNDPRGHERFAKSKRIEVEARHQGVLVRFATEIQRVGKSKEGIGFYRAAMPLFLFYFQRRDTHRIKITRQQVDFISTLGNEEGKMVDGYLHDISIGGVGIISKTELILQRGDILHNCRFTLPEAGDIECNMEIRFLQTLRQQAVTRIGCQFMDISARAQDMLTQEIARLEREQLRMMR